MLLLRTLLLRCFIIDSRSFQSSAVPVARAELCRFFRTSLCCFELVVQSQVRLAVQSRVRLTVQSRVLLTLQTLLDPEHSYVLGAENHMCWGKASIIQELEAPTPLSRNLALALAACSAFGQMVRQALRGIEWSFGRHLVERRGGAPHRCHCRAFSPGRSCGTPGRAGVKATDLYFLA